MVDIFISYSHNDIAFVQKLAASLRPLSANTGIWMDTEDISAGSNWHKEIEQGLVEADLMILVLSSSSMSSNAVKLEWQTFLKQNKRIIPIRIDAGVNLPATLRKLQYIDFVGQSYDRAFDQLLNALREHGARLYSPVAPPSTPAPVGPKDKTDWGKWGVIAAIAAALIGAFATIGAPIIDHMLNQPAPTSISFVTPSALPVSVSPSFAPTKSPAQSTLPATTSSAAPVNASSGTIPAFTLIYGGADSLTLIVTAPGDMTDVVLSTALRDETISESFDVFSLNGSTVSAGMCFRYERDGASDVLPRNCHNPYKLPLNQADVFWYDNTQNRLLDIAVKHGGTTVKLCSAASPSCDVS